MTDEEYELYIRAKVYPSTRFVISLCQKILFLSIHLESIPLALLFHYGAVFPSIKTYTSFHPCGTTKMAPRDKGGVVDHHLCVYGTKRLRVVDASIFPEIPLGNLNAPTGMVAWRASTFIIKDYQRRADLQ